MISAAGAMLKTTEIESDLISAPTITGEPTNYVVYVTGYGVCGLGSRTVGECDGIRAGDVDLYAFYPDGNLKFKVRLSQ